MSTVDLTGVAETMLQTMYARAVYSQKPGHKFYDGKAIEIAKAMNYDFSKADKDALMSSGVLVRTILLDGMVKQFVDENPNGTVVNIACGLDTRFYRVDNGQIRWYNLDLPETIAVRRRFLREEGRVSMIPRSAMDLGWTDRISPDGEKVLVVIESLSMYLTQQDVGQILGIIAARFYKAKVIMEFMNPWVVGHVKEKSIEASQAKFTWGARSGEEIAALCPVVRWVEDVSLVDGMKELYPIYRVIGKIPALRNLSNKLAVLEACKNRE